MYCFLNALRLISAEYLMNEWNQFILTSEIQSALEHKLFLRTNSLFVYFERFDC